MKIRAAFSAKNENHSSFQAMVFMVLDEKV
jgi:hypothetical protein